MQGHFDHDDLFDDPQTEFPFPLEQENVLKILSHAAKEFPNEMIQALLETFWWPKNLDTLTNYSLGRYEDDSWFGKLSVSISPDADTWIDVFSTSGADNTTGTMRFRTFVGGGNSPRVRNALLILAEAIRLDNEKHPQYRGEPPK